MSRDAKYLQLCNTPILVFQINNDRRLYLPWLLLLAVVAAAAVAVVVRVIFFSSI